jgi:hypothetical protein
MSAKKKTTKKKTAKKKAAKKKAAKKRAASRNSRTSKIYTISIRSSIPCSYNQHLKKNTNSSTKGPDKVTWTSEDGKYELTFASGWPFSTAPTSGDPQNLATDPPIIEVPAQGSAGPFKIDPDADEGELTYDIQPPACPHPDETGKKPGPVIGVDGP